MIKITFSDGSSREYANPIKMIDIAKKKDKAFVKTVIAFELNGELVDPTYEVTTDATVKFYTFEDSKGKEVYWHSSAHIMAQAVQSIFPDVKVAIGPAIKEGFYYDFDREPFTDEELVKITKEVNKILKSGIPFKREVLSRNEALDFFEKAEEPYKIELIENLDEDATITTYTQGDFTDLCRGPHVANTSKIKNFKILSSSGAYWRGDVNRPMLQRIYAISFPEKADLDLFMKRREEAAKRDHRKLGRELDMFSFHPEAPGIPFYHNNGIIVRNLLIDYWRYEHTKDGYIEIETPLIMTKSLWETSGHWQNYKENMFTTETEGQEFAIKPMNCPGGMLWYKSSQHSYRTLPLKVAELGHVHRNEFSGALSGLFRVRSFVQDDAHIFMRPTQIKEEILRVLRLNERIYNTFGLEYHLELSTKPEKAIGTDEEWDIAIDGLRSALEEYGQGYIVNEGDGAFYGPKIDIYVKNAIGKEWQCGTVQLDMQLPERFDLTYIDENSDKKRVVMIHRALYGSLERFLGIILEHFGGFFPLWIAPIQVTVIPISEKFGDFAAKVRDELRDNGFRVDYDDRSEKVGYKIREADGVKKVPYMLVIGEKEQNEGKFTVRQHKKGDIGEFELKDLISRMQEEVKSRKLPEGYKLEI